MSLESESKLSTNPVSTPARNEPAAMSAADSNRLGLLLSELFQDDSNQKPPSGRWIAVLACVCVIALGVSGYLGWVALTSSKVAGCGGGRLFNCGHVISSRWSLWLGIPVSLLASGLYTVMGAALIIGSSSRYSSPVRQAAWGVVTLLAISAGMAAIWFISLQIFVLKHLCSYCLIAHSCGLLAAGIALTKTSIGNRTTTLAFCCGVVGMGILIAGQMLGEVPKPYRIETFETPAVAPEAFEFQPPGATSEDIDDTLFEAPVLDDRELDHSSRLLPVPGWHPGWQHYLVLSGTQPTFFLGSLLKVVPQEIDAPQTGLPGAEPARADSNPNAKPSTGRRVVAIQGGTIKLDVSQWPVSGPPNARYIFVEMFDYSCPHCRKTHGAIKSAAEKLQGDLAVIALPVPLNAGCNDGIRVTDPKFVESCEISKLAVAVWRTAPNRFSEFHNWMFSDAVAPTYSQARAFAETLVEAKKLNAELESTVPGQYVSQIVELYKRVGSGNVPKLMFPGTSIVGEFSSGDSLARTIETQIQQ